ncbi:MAG TPA: hypothetical protein VF011_00760 [Terriglobales bacterium]
MHTATHNAFEILWVAELVLESVVIAAMIWRKAYLEFKWFFCYMVWQVLQIAILYPCRSSQTAYFYAYCITSPVSLGLGFGVIHEIFMDVFRPFHTLRDLGSVLFKWAGLVMLLVAMIVSASGQAIHREPLVDATIILQRSTRVVQCGLILFLLLFSKYLGISWRQRSFGIALGFGIYATLELSVVALRLGAHISEDVLNLITMSAYVGAIGIWITYSLMKVTSRESAVTLLRPQRWEQSLSDLHSTAKHDSLIPMFEGMVDRAFSRNHSSFRAVDPVPLSPTLSADVGLSPNMPVKSFR